MARLGIKMQPNGGGHWSSLVACLCLPGLIDEKTEYYMGVKMRRWKFIYRLRSSGASDYQLITLGT